MKKTNIKTVVNTQVQQIALSSIRVSPFNHGREGEPITEESVSELAESIAQHGVIQPVTVRATNDELFEIVVGERRFTASRVAGLTTIPAIIRELTDDQVIEIQVIENLQRKNPHPLAEAKGISKMLQLKTKYTVEDVAIRLGKSKTYIYQRLKLTELCEQFQEMFLANVISISQATKLARLDADSQKEFFDQFCTGWLKEGWSIWNFSDRVESFQLDLAYAPFDITNAKLDKKAGACTKCPNNTAATTSLFPEDSEDARCTNRPCYLNKCTLAARIILSAAIEQYPDLPIATQSVESFYKLIPPTDRTIANTTVLVEDKDFHCMESLPNQPKREDFTDYEDEEDNQSEFEAALEEYNDDRERLENAVASGSVSHAISGEPESLGQIVYLHKAESQPERAFYTESRNSYSAKDYQEAVKTKTLTPEIIEAEKSRILAREERSKEIDQEKLQTIYYEALQNSEAFANPEHPTGGNDRAAMIFILFHSIGYWNSHKFRSLITGNSEEKESDLFDILSFAHSATDQQVSLLIRHALLNISDVKKYESNGGTFLRQLVELTPGLNAQELNDQQQKITDERTTRIDAKITLLDKQAEKIKA